MPTLRAGRQPYGLLPAISLDLLAASPAGTGRFVQSLHLLRGVWKGMLAGAPRLSGDDDANALVEILRVQPASVGYRARLAMDGQFFAPIPVFASALSAHLQSHAQLLRARVDSALRSGLLGQERFFELIPADSAVDLRGPLVSRGAEAPGAQLGQNYITFLRTASFDDILNERLPAGFPAEGLDALLYLLLRHSVLLAYATTAQRILIRKGRLPNQRHREAVLVDILGGAAPTPTPTLLRAATADATLRSKLHTLTAAEEPEAAALEELRASLAHLEKLPVDALERQVSGCLDLWAYRLDAWITSLATRRLIELRKATPRGLALGGFGWVHDLQPSPRTPAFAPPGEDGASLFVAREPGGFIHAPSTAQASAAAVLRSGYLAHAGVNEAGPLAVDLSSSRVRLAESLLDGIRQGQQLGALLGYRFERGLHDRKLDRFIAGFRRLSWLGDLYFAIQLFNEALALPPGPDRLQRIKEAEIAMNFQLARARDRWQIAPTAGMVELEAVAATKVVDGMALVRLLHGPGISFDRLGVNVPPGNDRPAVDAELAALDQALDAVSDALTAESVYQLVRGNPARAAATVDAVAHGEIQPPELQFPVTPRPGIALTHRLLVVLSGPGPTAPTDLRAARRAAEPNLDAWLEQMVGGVGNVRLQAEFLDEKGEVLAAVEDVRLTPLGLSNTDVLYLSASSEPGLPSDLERLLEHHLRRAAPPEIPAGARVRLDYGRVPQTQQAELSLGEFLELNAAFRSTVLGARALDNRDFVHASSETPTGVDAAELQARAGRAVASLQQARDALTAQLAAAGAEPSEEGLDALRERLVDLVFLGVPEAVPLSARGDEPADRDRLLAQAGAVEQEAARRLEKAQAAEDPQARLEAVFGRGFRVLPLVRPANAAEIGKALGASNALLGGEPLRALSWLQGISRVRPGRFAARGRPRLRRRARAQGRARPEGGAAAVRRGRALGRVTPVRGRGVPAGQGLAGRAPAAPVSTGGAARRPRDRRVGGDGARRRGHDRSRLQLRCPGRASAAGRPARRRAARPRAVGARDAGEDPARDARARAATRARPAGARRRRGAPTRAAGDLRHCQPRGRRALDGLLQGGELTCPRSRSGRGSSRSRAARRSTRGCRRRRTIRCGCSRGSGRRASSRPRTPGRRCRHACASSARRSRGSEPARTETEGSRTGPTSRSRRSSSASPFRGPETRAGISASRPRPASTS